MTNYKIKYVPDAALGGRDFVLCSQQEDGVTLYMREGVRGLTEAENIAVWEEAWAAFRELAAVDEIPPRHLYAV